MRRHDAAQREDRERILKESAAAVDQHFTASLRLASHKVSSGSRDLHFRLSLFSLPVPRFRVAMVEQSLRRRSGSLLTLFGSGVCHSGSCLAAVEVSEI